MSQLFTREVCPECKNADFGFGALPCPHCTGGHIYTEVAPGVGPSRTQAGEVWVTFHPNGAPKEVFPEFSPLVPMKKFVAEGPSGEAPREAGTPRGGFYRSLVDGETIQPGDEVWAYGKGPWEPVADGIGEPYRANDGKRDGRYHHSMRRPAAGLPAPEPSPAEGSISRSTDCKHGFHYGVCRICKADPQGDGSAPTGGEG